LIAGLHNELSKFKWAYCKGAGLSDSNVTENGHTGGYHRSKGVD